MLSLSVPLLLALAPPDIRDVPADLVVPAAVMGEPAAGRRVPGTLPEYAGTEVHHLLSLPTDWQPGGRYPVIVEYAGNGNYRNQYGDVSEGTVEGSNLGYGLSGGEGFIWLCLPYVDRAEGRNQPIWWGDVEATCTYARQAVRMVCERYGGDPSAVVLTGFSRGAIGCGYLGLHDDATADVWLAFVPFSHYDGVIEKWPYPGADRASARERLNRLRGRASFICYEGTGEGGATRQYLEATGVAAPFTYRGTGFRNHNDAWTLRPSPARQALREWLAETIRTRPGTHTIRGRVVDTGGRGQPGLLVESGETHFTLTGGDGKFELAGLLDGVRTLRCGPTTVEVRLGGANLDGVELVIARPVG